MKIIITGGAGFLGRRLTEVLQRRGSVTTSHGERAAIDSIVWYDQPGAIEAVSAAAPDGVELVGGDITDAAGFAALLDTPEIGIFHLASVVSGQGEQDFDLAMRVNLDGTRAVLEAARRHEGTPRLVATSSVAVFGPGSGPAGSDQAPPRPGTTYGMTKAILELMIDDYTRKGFLDGRVARIPTVIIRPGKPNAAASSAASAVFREPIAGRPYAVPVAPETRMAVGGAAGVVAGLADLFELPSGQARNVPHADLPECVRDVHRDAGGAAAGGAGRVARPGDLRAGSGDPADRRHLGADHRGRTGDRAGHRRRR